MLEKLLFGIANSGISSLYSSYIAVRFLGITLLFAISYQNFEDTYPDPAPSSIPDQAKHYRDQMTKGHINYWACASHPVLYMRWPDRNHRKNQSDLWFDRLVYIHHEGNYDFILKKYTTYSGPRYRNIADLSVTLNGIVFDSDRILTSYNPFRQILKFAFKRHYTHVCAIKARHIRDITDDAETRYLTRVHKISCARQVVPLEETKDMPENLWHGRANAKDFIRQHSPLHDLMVIRVEDFIHVTKDNYEFDFLNNQRFMYHHGPPKTFLAKKDDIMGSEFKFAMMGHIFQDGNENEQFIDIKYQDQYNPYNFQHKEALKRMRDTYVGYYDQSDNVLTDCDEWIPREWGWFICVLNKQGLRRLASGAALYSRGLLFGIGSFTLFKGNKSIIVFTDVRPYEHLITHNETGPCTLHDQFG